ncbi:MAG: hypothetical protein ACI9W4_002102 [Rhodothermales bacterium]
MSNQFAVTAIPFKLPDDGFTELIGTVRADDEFVILHVQTSLMGEWNKEERIIKIEIAAVEDVHLKTSFFGDKLCLVPKREESFQAVPGVQLGELVLKTRKKDRSAVESLVEAVDRGIVGF